MVLTIEKEIKLKIFKVFLSEVIFGFKRKERDFFYKLGNFPDFFELNIQISKKKKIHKFFKNLKKISQNFLFFLILKFSKYFKNFFNFVEHKEKIEKNKVNKNKILFFYFLEDNFKKIYIKKFKKLKINYNSLKIKNFIQGRNKVFELINFNFFIGRKIKRYSWFKEKIFFQRHFSNSKRKKKFYYREKALKNFQNLTISFNLLKKKQNFHQKLHGFTTLLL
ncbi:hypothetical protein HAN_1g137 (nucleomorph) [Hemiselmis andersenii]|uniref:Uncharacterized protein n=1 Tax=Hemiselmis andersenii TaxID=464988 RepID=A9BKE2_HEMAN|nr:hypothetical protein HAN_1g137 [Hemiselmis andersenii]ABW97975.1 hypothetical protein HAN_1g137 [Hemiselmis andersenii]|mmetsp:Transcript_27023/g.65741  ORF Transcript_27023/g.65741 Transcript_27023/m.65741 type:complete len:222 (+) Transcript_27023:1496-2161(+)